MNPKWAVCVSLLFAGCFQTAQIHTAQHNYYQKRFDDAAARLDPANIPKRDALLALLERGMALQAAGRYAESAEAWREAEPLMDQQDVFHVGEQALSLMFDQNILAYQPAPYEPPFLHALLCLDYLQLEDFQSARVEALKSLKDLDRRESIVGPIAFVRYTAALAFEASGDAADAYIEYKKIHESGVAGCLPALARLSAALGFEEDHARYRAALSDTESPPSTEADIPAIVFLGKSPRKVASEVILADDYKILLPVYQTQAGPIRGVRISASDDESLAASSTLLTSVESLATNFSGRLFAGELLKEVLRRKAQKHLLKKVGDKVGSTTETLLKTIFFFAKEADLRTWSSLPAQVHLVRIPSEFAGRKIDLRYSAGSVDRPSAPAAESFEVPAEKPFPLALLRAW